MHPLYNHARSLIGQHVYVHAYGRVHQGILHQVTTDGVYLQPVRGSQMMSAHISEDSNIALALNASANNLEAQQVFWPFFFLPFLAIAAMGPWWWW